MGRKKLWGQLLFAFSSVIFAAAVLMHLSNRYVSRYPPNLLAFNAEALAVIFGFWILICGAYIRFRLRPYSHMSDGCGHPSDQTGLWVLLTRFPSELFGLTLILGFAATALYEFAERQYMRKTGFTVPDDGIWLWLAKGIVLNLSTTFLLAAVFYGLARLILRPHVLQVQRIDVARVSFRSFSRQLIFTFVIVLAMVIIRIFWYAANSRLQHHPMGWQVLFAISVIGLFGGMLLFYLIAIGYRRQAQSIEARIYGLIREGKAGVPRKVSVTASDETGELAAALNDLQIRLGRDYAALEEELSLALKVREKLFPEPQARCGRMEIMFQSGTEPGSGGEFYDIAEADDRCTAVIAGRVPEKGAAAVLMISALLALFRSEARRGGTAGSIMRRLQTEWTESFPEWAEISAGLVLIHRLDHRATVSRTGNTEAARISEEGFRDGLSWGPDGKKAGTEAVWEPQSGESLRIGPGSGHASGNAGVPGEETFWIQITRR